MKRGQIILIIIIAVAIGAISLTFSGTSTYGDFSEAKNSQSELHIVGKLCLDKAMEYDPIKDPNYFSFFVKDAKGLECKVVFTGTKPQDFEKSEQVVLTGQMDGEEFHANKILMKCPSKYNETEVVAGV